MPKRLLVSITALALIAAACGSDEGDEAATTDAAVSSTTAAASSSDGSTTSSSDPGAPVPFTLTVADIDDGGVFPVELTCDGANDGPTVVLTGTPEEAVELVLIVDDPDAPTADPFVHWVVYGVAAESTEISDGMAGFSYGANDVGTEAWFGPCPPPGDGPHTYQWRLLALDAPADLEAGLDGRGVEAAVEGSVIATAEFTASYERAE